MFDIITADYIAYFESERTAGGLLEGIESVRVGDYPVPTEMHPSVTIDWDDQQGHSYNGNHSDFRFDFTIGLYVVSLESDAEADAKLQSLLLRYDVDSGKFFGLLPALHKRTGWRNTLYDLCFLQTISRDYVRGKMNSDKMRHHSAGAIIPVSVTHKTTKLRTSP